MIAIVNTGGANIASVINAIERLGRKGELTSDPELISRASHVILPGVGSAGDAMARIDREGLAPVIRGLKQPVLGICLGMQLLFERSSEGNVTCLGLLPGSVEAITPCSERGITVPHMGWNNLEIEGPKCALLEGVGPDSYFYFVHSFQAPKGSFVRATAMHGDPVVAVIEHKNFAGVQFHPERSGSAGAQLLERFLKL